MSTTEAIRASTTGTLNPTSISGEKCLRRANDETALFLYRMCIENSSSLFSRASEINTPCKSETIWFVLSLYDTKRYYSFEGGTHSWGSHFLAEKYLKSIEKS